MCWVQKRYFIRQRMFRTETRSPATLPSFRCEMGVFQDNIGLARRETKRQTEETMGRQHQRVYLP